MKDVIIDWQIGKRNEKIAVLCNKVSCNYINIGFYTKRIAKFRTSITYNTNINESFPLHESSQNPNFLS